MTLGTAALVRRWAWVAAGATGLAIVAGMAAFFLTGFSWPLAVAFAVPWMLTGAVGTFSAARLPAWMRVYAWCGAFAALVTLLFNPEDWGDRVVFAVVSFFVPPMALVYVAPPMVAGDLAVSFFRLVGPFFGLVLGVVALACVGVTLAMPAVYLKRWADDAAVSHLVWLAWAGSLALAGAIAGIAEEEARGMLAPLVVASVVALLGLWAPFRFARQA